MEAYIAFLSAEYNGGDGTMPEILRITASDKEQARASMADWFASLGYAVELSQTSEEVTVSTSGKEYVYYGFSEE